MDERFTITNDWIEAHKTPAGAWTYVQLHAIGVKWPPRKGWRRLVSGTTCTEAQRQAFEGPPVYSKKTLKLRKAREVVTYMDHKTEQLERGVW